MEHESPIKQWLQKHSPVKRLNKPLPSAPPSTSRASSRQALHTTSGNTSPTKPNTTTRTTSTKSKLRSFLGTKRSKPTHASPTASPSRHTSHHRRNQSNNSVNAKSPGGIRKTLRPTLHNRRRSSSRDLSTLSRKITNLESQLKQAKRELKTFSRETSRPSSVEVEKQADFEKLRRQLEDVRSGRDEFGFPYTSASVRNHDVSARGRGNDIPGLAETLVRKSQRDRYGQDPHRGLRYKSTDDLHLDSAAREQAFLEAESSDSEAEAGAYHESHDAALRLEDEEFLRRHRSDLRRQSWDVVQDSLRREERLNAVDRKRPSSTEPPASVDDRHSKRTRRASSHDSFPLTRDTPGDGWKNKELPPIREASGSDLLASLAVPPVPSLDSATEVTAQSEGISAPQEGKAIEVMQKGRAHRRTRTTSSTGRRATPATGHARNRKSLPNPPMEILDMPVPALMPPMEDAVAEAETMQPRKGHHRRRSSILLSRDEVKEALGFDATAKKGGSARKGGEEEDQRPPSRGKQSCGDEDAESVNWTVHASTPSSSPRKCQSPCRLERVEEEYEWDEEVF